MVTSPAPDERDWEDDDDSGPPPGPLDEITAEELADLEPRQRQPSARCLEASQSLLQKCRKDLAAPGSPEGTPRNLQLWCDPPAPTFPGLPIPRRERAELVLAAAMAGEVLPARDVRPRPPAASLERAAEQPETDDAASAPARDEEKTPDFSIQEIRRHVQQRWDHRPAGIRYARWEAILEDFSRRMAARIAAEDQMAEEGAAAGEGAGAVLERSSDDESVPEQEADREEQQQSNVHELPSAGEPQKTPLEATGTLGRA